MALVNGIYAKLTGNSPEEVHPALKNKRMAVCKACPELVFGTNCGICACFVNWKTKFKAEECPKKKWKKAL